MALDQLDAEGSSRDRAVVEQYRLSRKNTGSSHPLAWGSMEKTEEYITQQLTIGELHFDVIDFGESAPLTESCRKMIVCPESSETKQCTILHWAAAIEWNEQRRSARIPLRSRVYQVAQQARMEEASVARMIEKSTSDNGRMRELRSLLHDSARAHRERDFRTLGLVVKNAFGTLSDAELRILDVNAGYSDVI